MTKSVHIDTLRTHLDHAKERLSSEKAEILKLYPLETPFSREEYAFVYVRAERLGMRAINRRLAEIAWLPMQLDPRSEIMSESRSSMKRWVTAALAGAPGSEEFGNDFMHALARCGLSSGWDSPDFIKLAGRVANLFRDLSCLIGLIYYCTWLSENSIEALELSDPTDLNRTAEEIAILLQSPEIYRYLRAQEQNDDSSSDRKTRKKSATVIQKKKARPALRVIENESFVDPFIPDPATV
jgi:hypothetical protein